MTLKATVLDLLDELRGTYEALADSLGEAERESGPPDEWAAKDVLAHTSTWQQTMLAEVQAWLRGEPVEQATEFEARNQQIYEENRERPWDEVWASVEATHARVRSLVEGLTDEQLATPYPTEESERTLWRRIVGNGYLHPVLHLVAFHLSRGDVAAARQLHEAMAERLPALDPSDAVWRGTTQYNLACFHALTGEPDRALALLGEAFALAPYLREWATQDSDMDSLREQPAYQALVAEEPATA